jgi:cysteinyl-tRNA synthetase
LAVIDQAAQAGYGVAEEVRELCRVLGLFSHDEPKAVEVTADVQALVQQREAARKNREFQTADRLRKEVEGQGFIIEDTPSGPLLLKRKSDSHFSKREK